MPHVEHISIKGFKSIQSLYRFEIKPLNVLIGANGTGKSNLLSLLNKMISSFSRKQLQLFIRGECGPDAILFGGRKITSTLDVSLSFENNRYVYDSSLKPAFDSVAFSREKLSTLSSGSVWPSGSSESCMIDSFVHAHSHRSEYDETDSSFREFASYVLAKIKRWQVFHFQDMSDTARVRNHSDVRDNLRLKSDAGNLVPILRHLREHYPNHFRSIRDVVRLSAPFFKDFVY